MVAAARIIGVVVDKIYTGRSWPKEEKHELLENLKERLYDGDA